MLINLVIILIGGAIFASLFEKIKMPGLVGMILFGLLISPGLLDTLSADFYVWSGELRQLALIIILLRAGLTLNIASLRKNGLPAMLLCFVPASFEIAAVAVLGPYLFGLSLADALILGAVLAAVSPAVIVPRMIDLIKLGYGQSKGIPQMLIAGSSADDIFVIILFSAFMTMAQGGGFNFSLLWNIPISIITGLSVGYLLGKLVALILKYWQPSLAITTVFILGILIIMVNSEDWINRFLPFSALLAVMSCGLALQVDLPEIQTALKQSYQHCWNVAQIVLFVLVGTSLDLAYIGAAGFAALILITLALIVRSLGVWLCLLPSNLSKQEKTFSTFAYLPKATVQAAIGGIPLSAGLASGPIILAVAIIAILTTAPIGAFLIDHTYAKLLDQSHQTNT
ncbi:cation:proton antiporter [Aerococcus kribbianus]|uniref:Cation:proton antiporter n=1 Tax=Aerococcus kribbianus TaxID=2999064 RepID=A0A9X3FM67_9LACT|nr:MULTISPECIES: cation:proton antiporter [unclassified Aerococcus]MCZ0717087.1 cation:proton antiporter [Aerococcus sp. YH-aer221]MCZ0725375.1 cation:proton antiporter [Aerococcus sp. YH-aer222]